MDFCLSWGVSPHIGDDAPPEWCPFRGNHPMSDGSPRGFCLSWGGRRPPYERRKPLGSRNFYVGNIENNISVLEESGVAIFSSEKAPAGALAHTLYF